MFGKKKKAKNEEYNNEPASFEEDEDDDDEEDDNFKRESHPPVKNTLKRQEEQVEKEQIKRNVDNPVNPKPSPNIVHFAQEPKEGLAYRNGQIIGSNIWEVLASIKEQLDRIERKIEE